MRRQRDALTAEEEESAKRDLRMKLMTPARYDLMVELLLPSADRAGEDMATWEGNMVVAVQQGALWTRLGLHSSTVSKMVSRLVELKLVGSERRGRTRWISLTQRGLDLIRAAVRLVRGSRFAVVTESGATPMLPRPPETSDQEEGVNPDVGGRAFAPGEKFWGITPEEHPQVVRYVYDIITRLSYRSTGAFGCSRGADAVRVLWARGARLVVSARVTRHCCELSELSSVTFREELCRDRAARARRESARCGSPW